MPLPETKKAIVTPALASSAALSSRAPSWSKVCGRFASRIEDHRRCGPPPARRPRARPRRRHRSRRARARRRPSAIACADVGVALGLDDQRHRAREHRARAPRYRAVFEQLVARAGGAARRHSARASSSALRSSTHCAAREPPACAGVGVADHGEDRRPRPVEHRPPGGRRISAPCPANGAVAAPPGKLIARVRPSARATGISVELALSA